MAGGISVGGLMPGLFTWTYAVFAGLFALLAGAMILPGTDHQTAIWRVVFPAATFFLGAALFSAHDAHPIRWASLPDREIDTSIRVARIFQATGGRSPYRLRIRSPSFNNISTLPHLVEGGLIADVIANIASLDPVLGEVDR